jgi:hypothetical protein
MYPDHPIAGPDRTGRPHLTRTAVLLALIAAALLGAAWIVAEITDTRIPPEVVRPAWYVENNPTPSGTTTPGDYVPSEVWGN